MQAILRSSLLLIAAASFAACGAKSDTSNARTDDVTSIPQVEEVEAVEEVEEAAELNCDEAPLFADSLENCGYTANGRCFETAAEACACAGCDEDRCIMTRSLPGQASCGE